MIWKVQILRGTRRRMVFGSQNNLSTNNLLVCTLGTGISFIITITAVMNQYLLKQRGLKSYELIRTSLGTWNFQLLMPILLMATFKMGMN